MTVALELAAGATHQDVRHVVVLVLSSCPVGATDRDYPQRAVAPLIDRSFSAKYASVET